MTDLHSTHSTLRERVVEHVFVGEALRALWRRGVVHVEVLRSEFDAHGYDLVMVRRRIVRHIQFKTGTADKPDKVSVSRALTDKPSGCVIWIHVTDDLQMGPYFWYGGRPGEPLPSMDALVSPRRATHNKAGVRPVRQNHRLVPGEKFEKVETLEDVLARLLGEFRYDFMTCAGADLPELELAACAALVQQGGAVQGDCRAKLRRAMNVAVASCQGSIVAVGTIKALRPDYASSIAQRSGFALSPETPELGYVAVDEHHKGNDLSHRVVAELLKDDAGALFATTSNDRMKSVLTRAGFLRQGHEWQGRDAALSLWIKG